MSKTYKKNDDSWEQKRRKEERKRERYAKKREFFNEPKGHRKNDEDGEEYRGRQ